MPSTSSMNRSRSPSPLPSSAASEKPPLPPRRADVSPSLSAAQSPPITLNSGLETQTVGTKDRLILSMGLILSTIDKSAKQIMEVSSQQLNAVVEHKCVCCLFLDELDYTDIAILSGTVLTQRVQLHY